MSDISSYKKAKKLCMRKKFKAKIERLQMFRASVKSNPRSGTVISDPINGKGNMSRCRALVAEACAKPRVTMPNAVESFLACSARQANVDQASLRGASWHWSSWLCCLCRSSWLS